MIIGSGGHAKVVLAALRDCLGPDVAVVLRDGNPDRAGADVMGCRVVVPDLPEGDMAGQEVHVAIGHNAVRLNLLERARARGAGALTILHPRAVIHDPAGIGAGSLAAAGCIVGPDARVGPGTIINHAAVVDHDCRIGAGVHIAPGAVLGGGVQVGDRVLVGANATVLPGLEIGADAVIGAGAVVTKPVASGQTWIGTAPADPARRSPEGRT